MNLSPIFQAIRSCGAKLTNADLEARMIEAQVELEASAIAAWAEGVVYDAQGDWRRVTGLVRAAATPAGLI